jgi:spore germination protein KA
MNGNPSSDQTTQETLSGDMVDNLNRLKKVFTYPDNVALTIRHSYVQSMKLKAAILYLEGAADTMVIEKQIMEPLHAKNELQAQRHDKASVMLEEVLTSTSGSVKNQFGELTQDLLHGYTIVLIEDQDRALSIHTPGFISRSVTEPQVEHVLKGPKEAFIESASVNRSLIRKQLKDSQLVTEIMKVGNRALNDITILYLKDLADPALVERVKKRISQIEADTVPNLEILEQHIEDYPYSLLPTVMLTERPDRACSFLMEGHVVLLMENSPTSLILPITFWALFHTPEDQYLRWAYGNFIRFIRILAIFVALLTPSLYIAVSTFHEEMLPTDLLLAIGATRERVPFPALIEVLLMEAAFELVREAAIRIPTIIGPTIGIVGALILGQAAVEANLVSPILVIIVAMTGISSYTIPELSFNFAVRILRFVILFAAAFMGFFGIALTFTSFLAYLVSFTSFGVPFVAPLSPHDRSSKDLIVRPPVWKQWLRPFTTNPQNKQRMNKPKGKS